MEIQQLSPDVIDKIAAGEVVERPAHLLKELVENSIDAGATKISVEVDEGGKNISVVDNGQGVVSHELPRVFDRHATSKIHQSEDLWKLSTFGFRGEALASISSVSQMDFISHRKGKSKAYCLQCHFGQLGEVLETSAGEGTGVHVKKLFENIPARLKFLKSDAGELAQIKNVMRAMALQYPQVEWRFKSKKQLVFFWPKEKSFLERAKKVLETRGLYESKMESEGFKAHIIFSDPSNVVRVSRQIWIFVQNRWVQDRGLQAAVMEAYRSLLMHGQYPICFVSVKCPPDQVDVNIHPTKSQVKFVDPKKAFRVVHHCLRQALEKAPWLGLEKTDSFEFSPKKPKVQNFSFEDKEMNRTQFQKKNFYSKNQVGFLNGETNPRVGLSELRLAARGLDREPGKGFLEEKQISNEKSVQKDQTLSFDLEKHKGFWSQFQVIGQVDLTYIVAQGKDRMLLVDQHAAHERVAFERLMKSWKEGSVKSQGLLVPLTVDMDESEVETLMTLVSDLEKMGIGIEQAGPATVVINSQPGLIKEKALVVALRKMAGDSADKGGSFALETAIADIFATMACHSVVRAGQALSLEEMKKLLSDMDEFPLSGFCPHGRTVSLEFPFSQLEKDFGRRV